MIEDARHAMAPSLSPIMETQQTYDLICAEFARLTAVAEPQLVDRLTELAAALPPGSVVADVGCGPGRDATLLRERGFHVVGIDLSMGQLRAGNLPGPIQADMRLLPLRTASVDAIWCQAALLHIPREAVPGVLAEFARAVREGGRLSMSIAEGDGEGFEVASQYASDRRRWFTRHRESDLAALLAEAGFAVYQVQRHHANRRWLSLHSIRAAGAE